MALQITLPDLRRRDQPKEAVRNEVAAGVRNTSILDSASGHQQTLRCVRARSVPPSTTDMRRLRRHVRLVPCVDGSGLARAFFTVLQHWSVQPCVRPFDAVHMTAGHNALRGSGPDQHLAFKNALAHVGCPDRRIDRLCITCCLPSQPSHHASCPARSRLSRKRDGFLVSLAPGHHGPDHSRDFVGKRDSRYLGRPPRQ